MRRAVVAWGVVFALAFGVAAGAVLVLNATVFGAAGFVRVYLEAVARADAEGALGMPGVAVDPQLRDDLLVDDALAGITDLRDISVVAGGGGTEVVTVAWAAGDTEAESSFTVERVGSRFGLFPEWAFAVSPVAILELSVEHDARFDVNGVAAESGVAAADPVGYAVLVPGVYRVDHTSTYLEARAVDVVADSASVFDATLDVQPADALLEQITIEVEARLAECATQDVLFPTACPLGRAIPNRVVSTPEWSIVEYPELTVEPGVEFGTWLVAAVDGVAHLTVDVQSLFDGSVSTLDEDVPFAATYLVTIEADDATLRIQPLL
ncbi:hypothetical protein [Pseudolysinimonas yzui]|uniref:Uncharacterized protein n=1 Tax=Pseudolysinimonas yzui TaxID=2708254 RepID=A0A8J3M5G8_9MICO|nr:hypothetical protein [Pseudolysinimonas yzui]GHF21691.1 hypothetical protein GCM10011600_23340 [Pseudolysinimonas yzui]